MCGRFSLAKGVDRLGGDFDLSPPALLPRYNVAPTQAVLALLRPMGAELRWGWLRWDLQPSWRRIPAEGQKGNPLINARAETVATKPSFREAFARRRCLVMADGFYEWQALPGQRHKQPWRITLASREVFAMAAIWEPLPAADSGRLAGSPDSMDSVAAEKRSQAEAGGHSLEGSCALLTADSTSRLRPIHHRMPVILPPETLATWLAPDSSHGVLQDLVKAVTTGPLAPTLTAWPISRLINDVTLDDPRVMEPPPDAQAPQPEPPRPRQGNLFKGW